jgi:hypothetical protein
MLLRSTLRVLLSVAVAVITGGLLAPAALAAGPLHFGPFVTEETFTFTDCGFTVRLDTHVTDNVTIFLDDQGSVSEVIDRVRAPHDVFTNLETGRSVVVRGEFQEFIERIPGTDDYMKSISGFRYLVNEAGAGVTVQEVGRITYGDLEQTIVLWQAGKHDLAYDADINPTFCALLAEPA